MELKEILAVAGQAGLYKFVAQGARGVIVESLADGRRTNVPATARVSAMTDITIFTESADRPLAEVFAALFAQTGGKTTVGHKEDVEKVRSAFAAAVPDYDRERVHDSDIRKMLQWFNILVERGMTEFKVEEA